MLGALPPVFAGLESQDTQEAAGFLQHVGLEPGELVMEKGEEDLTLAFVSSGALQLMDGDAHIGSVGAREMVGEVELFGQMRRVATAVASGAVHLAVLDYDSYVELCNRGNPAVYNLERHALRRLGERLRWMDEGIMERSRGIEFEVPQQRSGGLLSRLFKGGAPKVEVDDVLSSSPLFDWADPGVVSAIAQHFEVQRFPEGHLLCQQGQVADRMHIIASGRVDVVLLTSPRTAEMVATLGPGQACGEAMMAQQTPRSASYVCREEVVTVSLERAPFTHLFSTNDGTGSTFRQGILRNVIALLLATQRRFTEVETHSSVRTEDTLRGTPVNTVWRD
ncbi:MAG: cyclic nucleotide-binding domain-containing protein [Myxococcales bacterium]|nr:cyclic nucleotide-binding domain-containing protein [Myxococcales bacterium]